MVRMHDQGRFMRACWPFLGLVPVAGEAARGRMPPDERAPGPGDTGVFIVSTERHQHPDRPAGLVRLERLFARLGEDSVREHARHAYAADAYFNDTIKEVRGIEAIERHLCATAGKVVELTLRHDDLARSGDNYYLRWTMTIRIKKRDQPIVSSGISHLRFDGAGLIIYHQDYWDPVSGLYEHLPVVSAIVRRLKRRA
jgi:hypothetical protein